MRRAGSLCICFCAISALIFGQGGATGSINGTVSDSSGAALPGVTVTVTSPALIGEETQITSDQGLYRFPTLPAGVYKVTFKANGFATLIREQITINAGFAAEINLNMTVATQQQTVVVTSEAPLVDTENANLQNSVSRAQMNNLANSRDMWSMLGITAGLNIQSMDIGGSAAGTQPAYTSYGYGTTTITANNNAPTFVFSDNHITIDGVNTTENSAAAGFYYDYGSLAEFTVSTEGNDATMPVPGVFVSAVVKSGGNDLHGSFYFDYENPNFQGHNIDTTQLHEGAGTGTRITQYKDVNGDIGGPVLKDRLWYFVSLRNQQLGNTVTGFPANNPGAGPDFYTLLQNITYKVSGQLSKNHRLSHYLQWGRKNQPYRNEASNYYADAVYNQNLFSWAGNITYDGIITPKFFVTVRAATWGYDWMNTAYKGPDGQIDPRRYEIQTGNYAGGYTPFRYNPRRYQFEPSGSYFLDNFLHANHQLKFGFAWEHEAYGSEQYGPLNQVEQIYSSAAGAGDFITPYEVGLFNGPAVTTDYLNHGGAYLQDQVRIKKRITLNLGARWDYYRLYEPTETVRSDATWRAFYYAGQPLPNGYSIPATNPNYQIPARQVLRYPFDISPRIGVAIDLTGRGRTVLKMNWGRFFTNTGYSWGANYVNGLQYLGTSGTYSSSTFIFKWNDPTNAAFNPSQIGAYVSGSSPAGVTVQPHIKDPVMDDAAVFLEHQVTGTLSVRAGFVYRYVHHNFEQVNTTLTSSLFTQPVLFTDPGRTGAGGTSQVQVYDIPAGTTIPVSVFQMQTPNGNNSSFANYEFSVNKRMANKFMAVGSFNWTGAHYLLNGIPTNPNMAINNYVKDSYWTAHISGTYQARWGILVSPILRAQAGQPSDRILNVTGLRVGTQAIPVEPFGTYRYQNIYVFDTRLEKQFAIRERIRIGAFFDLFNMFNSNGETVQSSTTGVKSVTISGTKYTYPLFLSPSTILAPRIFRLGVKFSF